MDNVKIVSLGYIISKCTTILWLIESKKWQIWLSPKYFDSLKKMITKATEVEYCGCGSPGCARVAEFWSMYWHQHFDQVSLDNKKCVGCSIDSYILMWVWMGGVSLFWLNYLEHIFIVNVWTSTHWLNFSNSSTPLRKTNYHRCSKNWKLHQAKIPC